MDDFKLIARVVSQKGTCVCNHRVGDEFLLGNSTPPGLCSWAFNAIFPFANVLQFGGSFPWEKDRDCATIACPDPSSPVVFEVRKEPSGE